MTIAVGLPLPGEFATTVAVNVTDLPKGEGFSEDTKLVVVLSGLTIWLRIASLVRKLPLSL